MPALDVCLQVARLAEAVGDNVPYVESVAKAAVIIFELLQQMGKNKEDAKELCESIANTIIVIDSLVRFKGEQGASCFKDICGEMEGYLEAMAQDMKDLQRKHRGFKAVFGVDKYRDAIQAYGKRVDDLKIDFLIHVTGDCLLEVTRMHCLLKDGTSQAAARHSSEADFVIRIPKKHASIGVLFFFRPASGRCLGDIDASSAIKVMVAV